MKGLIRSTAIYSLALYLLPHIISGAKITPTFSTYLIGGMALTILHVLIKPLINILSFPFNIGVLTTLTNVLLLYLVTVFVPDIRIEAFTSSRLNLAGVIIPAVQFNQFFAFIAATLVLSLIVFLLEWLRD